MPDKFGFDHLPNRGIVTIQCSEPDCTFGGKPWEMSDKIRHDHYMTHFREAQVIEGREIVYEIQGDIRVQPCRSCGSEFSQPRRRGRPRLECDGCKGKE